MAIGIAIIITIPLIIIKMSSDKRVEQPVELQPAEDLSGKINRFNIALSNKDFKLLLSLYSEIKSECNSLGYENDDCTAFITVPNDEMKKYINDLVKEAAHMPPKGR